MKTPPAAQPQPPRFHRFLLPSALLSAGAIFALDTQVTLGVAVGVLHVIPVLLVALLESWKRSLGVASLCTVLIVLKLAFWPMGVAIPWMVFANRGFLVLVVWVTLLLALNIIRTRRRLREVESLLTVCAWTKQVKVEGRWMPFDRYLSEHLGFNVGHGITQEAAEQVTRRLHIEIAET